MKMTLSASIVLYKTVVKILLDENGEERDLPFNVKFKLLRAKNMLEKDALVYENERVRLIEKYQINPSESITEETHKDFLDEIKKVLSAEVDHDFQRLTPEEVALLSIKGIANAEVELFMVLLVDDPDFANDLQTPISDLNRDGEVGDPPTNE